MGTDRANYVYAKGGVTADLILSHLNTGEAKGDTYVSIEELQGSRFNDVLRGDNRDNTLIGGRGNDILNGRGGNDTLVGQNGSDTFVFANGFGNAVVQDFDEFSAAEKIHLAFLTAITDFADLSINHLSQDGADALIIEGAGTIRIKNALIGDLGADDFVF